MRRPGKEVQGVKLDRRHKNKPLVVIKSRGYHHSNRWSHRVQLAVYLLHHLPGESYFGGLLLLCPDHRLSKELHGLLGQGDRLWCKDKAGALLFSVSVCSTHDGNLVFCAFLYLRLGQHPLQSDATLDQFS